MIAIVDEDYSQVRPFGLELELRNYEVRYIADADAALRDLAKRSDVELAIIDVMLAPDFDEKRSQFDRKQTGNYKFTGLELASRLLMENEHLKIVLFTMASSTEARERIDQFCKDNQLQHMSKSQFVDPYSFGDKIEEILQGGQR